METRQDFEKKFGQVWDTTELQNDFKVQAFQAPFVLVVRKSDNKQGSLQFNHNPRFYFAFEPLE